MLGSQSQLLDRRYVLSLLGSTGSRYRAREADLMHLPIGRCGLGAAQPLPVGEDGGIYTYTTPPILTYSLVTYHIPRSCWIQLLSINMQKTKSDGKHSLTRLTRRLRDMVRTSPNGDVAPYPNQLVNNTPFPISDIDLPGPSPEDHDAAIKLCQRCSSINFNTVENFLIYQKFELIKYIDGLQESGCDLC
jgi:hypothetical protein